MKTAQSIQLGDKLKSAHAARAARVVTRSLFLTLCLLSVVGCGDGKQNKMGRGVRDSNVVLYDNDDAPMRPEETDYDPLDHLDPDPSNSASPIVFDNTRTPPVVGTSTTPGSTPQPPSSLPEASDTSRTPPSVPRPNTTTPQTPEPLDEPIEAPSYNPDQEPAPQPPAPRPTPVATPRPTPRPTPPPSVATPLPTPRPTPPTSWPTPPLRPTPAPAPPTSPKATPKPTPRPTPLVTTTPPAKPKLQIRGFWDEKLKEGSQWTAWTINAIEKNGRALLKSTPKDIESFCPTYPSLGVRERADFWVKLISALAAAESDYRPEAKYTEAFADRQGNKVVSRGLLQISIESSQQYGCGFETVQGLHDPQQNLSCAVRIMSRWVLADDRLSGNDGDNWLGIGRYWSPFRTDSKKYEKIRALLRKIPVCR